MRGVLQRVLRGVSMSMLHMAFAIATEAEYQRTNFGLVASFLYDFT